MHPHPRPPAGALLSRRDRHDARRRALARPHGRLALRRRRSAPDLAVGATEGAEGLFHSLRRLLELPGRRRGVPGPRRGLALRHGDELARIDDDRLRAPLQPDARRSRSSTRSSRSRPACRRRSRRTSPHRRAQPGGRSGHARPHPRSSRRRPTARSSSTSARSRTTSPATAPARSACPSRDELLHQGRVRARRRSRRHRLASTAAEAARAISGLRSVAFADIAGFVLGGGPRRRLGVGRRARAADRRRRDGDRRARARTSATRATSPAAATSPTG